MPAYIRHRKQDNEYIELMATQQAKCMACCTEGVVHRAAKRSCLGYQGTVREEQEACNRAQHKVLATCGIEYASREKEEQRQKKCMHCS